MRRVAGIFVGLAAATIVSLGVTFSLAKAPSLDSGVPVGGMLLSFRPRHLSGPDKGTDTCPLCQYPANPAVQVWVNGDDENNVEAIATRLEKASADYGTKKLKTFIVYVNATHQAEALFTQPIQKLAEKRKYHHVALTYVHSGDSSAVTDNQINVDPKIRNTIFVYKARKVTAKFVNLTASPRDLEALTIAMEHVVK